MSQTYERMGEPIEFTKPEEVLSYTLPGSKDGTLESVTFKVTPPVVVQPGTYSMMVSKGLLSTRHTAEAVSYRIEDDVIYVDPLYNTTGQPKGY